VLVLGLIRRAPGMQQGKKEPAAAPSGPGGDARGGPGGHPVVTSFGVPECDAYVEKYTTCLNDKVSRKRSKSFLSFSS
jgi:hypothetical protein